MKSKLIGKHEMKIIESILMKWSGKLTWDKFAVSVAKALDRSSISKFTLMNYESIKQAFNLRKKTLREARSNVIVSMGDVTIDMLIIENNQLKEQISQLNEQLKQKENLWGDEYRKWQYNLSQMLNVDLSTLDKPLIKK